MSVSGIRLESVRRKTGGRVHLTPRVPRSGAVLALCGQTLAAGAYVRADVEADCANCIRRSADPSRISSAFFAQDEGSELLRLSLEQARLRKPASKEHRNPAPRPRPIVRVLPDPPAVPERIGELATPGFKAAGLGVWRSPAGVVVRMSGEGRARFAELVFEGRTVATRDGTGMTVRAGDVEVNLEAGAVLVRVRKP